MDKFEVTAADVIDIVLEKIEEVYPELKPKKEFLEESPDASILYGEAYYTIEAEIADKIRHEHGTKEEQDDGKYQRVEVE